MDKQAGIYARYSPGRNRNQTSTIEAQVAMCREKTQRDGVAIDSDHIYVMPKRSLRNGVLWFGSSMGKRSKMQERY